MRHHLLACLLLAILYCCQGKSQDSLQQLLTQIPVSYFDKSLKTTSKPDAAIERKSQKLLRKLQRWEVRLKRKLPKDNNHSFFEEGNRKYQELADRLAKADNSLPGKAQGEYMPYMDSLKGSLAFLKNHSNLLTSQQVEGLNDAVSSLQQFQGRLEQAEYIKQYVRERKQQLQDLLSRYSSLPKSISRQLNYYNKELYYYAEQLREYKEIFRDPDKLQRKALALLNRIPAFQDFMRENSALSGLFQLPGNYGSSTGVVGLQTRSQVQQTIYGQMGSGPSATQQISTQVQLAQSQLDQFKQKLEQLGGGSGDIEIPDFKPNTQRTKSFLQRLEIGTNFQSTKSNAFFPSTTDFGMSIGYKLSDKNIIGVGASYKLGWGRDIKHIQLSSEGIGLRSFFDIKIKKSLYASGGWEYNYQQPFNDVQQLYVIDSWQQSGLLGLTKVVSLKSKMFKKTKVQLLWDFMSYRQVPRAQPLKFRVGYNF